LVEVARRRGFTNIEVIDDDLGRTASGAVERPGFDRLVAALCAGQVGAVLCLEASRLARNGRDWHHLLELCGLVEARVIDLDGVYDPCRPNDRLLLGMKGSISEFELGIIRSRMYEAARSKAKRGELKISSPIGYAWDRYVGLGLDPDRRLQEVIRLVFQKFRELGSARQVLLWMASQNVHFPYPSNGRTLTSFEWRPIRYRNVISILKNPFYAGVYAYGKSEKRTTIVDGRARKSYGHRKPMGTWEVFIKDHHEGYISWAEYERNQALLAGNAYGRVGDTKSGRGGRALLAGLICCARCGRRLSVLYTGRYPRPIYRCEQPNVQLGQRRCLSVAGKRIDETIAAEMLRARREGPRCRATNHRDELASFQPIQLHVAPPTSLGRVGGYETRRGSVTRQAFFGTAHRRSATGHFRQIDPLLTLSACPLRSDRVLECRPRRLEAGALRPARLAARGTALIRLEAVERRAHGNLVRPAG
jgi:DNA invertase Pin-like site-specific DNA recombinase